MIRSGSLTWTHPERRSGYDFVPVGSAAVHGGAYAAGANQLDVECAVAAAQAQKRPLVLFSHGLSGMKNQNTIQAELLASHGITVISVDHAYDAYLTIFADGTVADYRSSDTENRTGDAFWAFRLPQLKTRVADLVVSCWMKSPAVVVRLAACGRILQPTTSACLAILLAAPQR